MKYPYGKIIIGSFACTPIILATAGSLLWTLGSFAALLSLDAVWCSLYENNKRKLILNHFEKMDNDDIPGMMTHLYRLQDHYKRTKSIEYHNPGAVLYNPDNPLLRPESTFSTQIIILPAR